MKRRDLIKLALAGGLGSQISLRQALAAVAPPITEVLASTLEGDEVLLGRARVGELQSSLSGRLLQHGHPAYDTTRRVWNHLVDQYPALIVQCLNPSDVQAAVAFAREHRLLTSVRCGGHNVAGKAVAENGLMIDLSLMNRVEIDPGRRLAWVEGGAKLGVLDTASLGQGMATPVGNDSDTGVGGLALGGGMGRLSRRFGLTIDNIEAVDIVTADGILRRASSSENPDLFWAIRGGGGNFGVVTRFKFRQHEIDPVVYGGHITFPFDRAAEFLTLFGQYAPELPDEMYATPMLYNDPQRGRLIRLEVCYSGDHSRGEQLLVPLRGFAKPLEEQLGPLPFLRLQTNPNPNMQLCRDIRSGFIGAIDEGVVEALVDHFPEQPGRGIQFHHLGGAVARVAPEQTAFQHRQAQFNILLGAQWSDPADLNDERMALRRQWRELMPHTIGFYTNLMEHGPRATRANYGLNLHRLVQVKTEFDPDNLFRLNANVPPAV